MRIVFLNPIGALGGAELSLLDLLIALRQEDEALDLHLVAGSEGGLLERAKELGVACHRLPMPDPLARLGDSSLIGRRSMATIASLAFPSALALPAAAEYVSRLKRLLRRIAPSLIHSNGLKFHLLTGLTRPHGVPVIWHIRDFPSNRPVAGRLLYWACRGTQLVLANSKAVANDVHGLLPRIPTQVLYNLIDLERFSPGSGSGEWLDQLGGLPPAPDGTVRVGLPATYARWKGQDVFLRAASQVSAHMPIRYFIVGGPVYKTQGSQFTQAELRSLADRHGLSDRVGFVPFQEGMPAVYRALDIVVQSSTRPEPFGRTIVEAMACGRAVIVSAAGGAVELFTPEHDALGVPPGDSAALAAAILRLASAPSLRRCLGEQARQTAVSRFNRDQLGQRLITIYHQLLNRPCADGNI